jgi:hypothetical protein
MHCKFEDVQSSRVLEVDLDLDGSGGVSKENVAQKELEESAVSSTKVE